MKLSIPLVIGLLLGTLVIGTLLGVSIGWSFGYQRYAKKQEELLQEYRSVKDEAKMTDTAIADLGSKIPQYFEDVKRQDEMAAIVAISAFQSLERGDVDATKRGLAKHIGSYHHLYNSKGGDPRLIKKIEAMAQDYSLIADTISPRVK